ncbi:MAG: YidC/Oxa1 family membrane protein insertase [Clostridia bacterium]|nr:YidC/Oxa1 family membrane protein insertase [Clostridia bacterium]
MFDFIADILGYCIRPIYHVVQNYGWTIILFTVFIKLVTLPLVVKSQKSMAKMQQVQPLIAELQKKYKSNQQKLNEEMSRIYQKYEISPLGGCLPMVVQLVVLFGFIQVVYRPLTYIAQIGADKINEIAAALGTQGGAGYQEIVLCGNPAINEEIVKLGLTPLNFDFFGINLTQILQNNMTDWKMWIIPVLALLLTFVSSYVTQKQQKAAAVQNAQASSMTKSMYIFMPIMTAWFSFTMPLGAALYWAISTFTQVVQQLLVQEFVVKKIPPLDIGKTKKKKPPVIVEAELSSEEEQAEEEEE